MKKAKGQGAAGKASSVGPRSLNISVRKRENERIERENQAFAKRLFHNPGSISKRRLDIEATNQEDLRNRIRKVKKPLPNLQGARNNQLPPLTSLKDGSSMYNSRSRRSFSTTNPLSATNAAATTVVNKRKEEAAEAQQNAKGMAFAAPGEMGGSNSVSAGVIPINNMYGGASDDEAIKDKKFTGSKTPDATVIQEETKEEEQLEQVAINDSFTPSANNPTTQQPLNHQNAATSSQIVETQPLLEESAAQKEEQQVAAASEDVKDVEEAKEEVKAIDDDDEESKQEGPAGEKGDNGDDYQEEEEDAPAAKNEEGDDV